MSQVDENHHQNGLVSFALDHGHLIFVVCLLLVILGGLALQTLPKDLLPNANLPAVQILSFYAGMPVDHVDQNLTARFARYTGQAVGMERQETKSLVGVSIVKNFFGPEIDLNTAIAQTTSLVMSVLGRLPPGTQPPLILPFDPMAATPLALVSVSGDFTEKELFDKARYDVRNTVQSVPGAMAPTVMGGSDRQINVFLDPVKLSHYNFSPLDVMNHLAVLNTFIPSGNIKIGDQDLQIVSNGLVDHVQEMNDFPLRSDNGVNVYLKNVGRAEDSQKVQTNIVTIDGKRQVYVPVYRQPGTNSLRLVDEVRESLKTLQETLKGYKVILVADQSKFIRHAIESITEEALIGGGLAALLIFLFLGNPRATVGIVLSLPLSVLFAFIGLKAVGQSINAMTLGGLALSIGVLVDNSIVVLENINSKLEKGLSATTAALRGGSEVALPVLAATLATMVVFFAVIFLSGISKTLFSALALSVIFAMIGSYFSAMAVMPLFASLFLKPRGQHTELPSILRVIQRGLEKFVNGYGNLLEVVLRRRVFVLLIVFVAVGTSCFLVPQIGTELFPRADAGGMILEIRQPTGVRVEKTAELLTKLDHKLREWIAPEDLQMIIANAGVYYGFAAAFTPNSGTQDAFLNIELTEDRKRTSQEYAKIIREKLHLEFPELDVGIELGGLLTSALNGGLRSPIDIQVSGPKVERSHELAEELTSEIRHYPGAVDLRIQQRVDAPEIAMNVNRQKAAELGLATDEVVKNVVSAVSGSSTFLPAIWVDPASGIDYLLGVQFPESKLNDIAGLGKIPITGRNQNRTVPLNSIATLSRRQGPSEINQVNLHPVVDIFLDAQDRDIGSLSRQIQTAISAKKLDPGYSIRIRGEISEMNRAVGSLGGGFLLAAILVYLILVVQFRSFRMPAIVMVAVPLGLMGIVVMLALTHTYFSIQAAIGAIFMIGIAVANGVLLLEFITHEYERTGHLHPSIVNGAKARLRPILMTSLASILGLLPMALGLGKGSEANIPLGRAVIGGQLAATMLTLFVVPLLYQILAPRKRHSKGADSGEVIETVARETVV
ncbi:MAG: AcrB/AcrD/AcrF family protein [Bdellovibrio sp.]|nr:MAG: AcrB/AcrD/AcrF family protein [Bdellovibrio sp.]